MSDTGDLTLIFIGFNLLMLSFMFPFILFIKLGGWPEGFYRIFRVKYFSPIFIDSESTPRRFPLRSDIIKTGAPELPPYFILKKPLFANGLGRYYLDKLNQTKHNGRMSQYYYPDNPFPIPVLTMAQNPMISAQGLEKAFNDETVLDFLKVGKERPKKSGNKLLYGALGFVIFISILGMLAFLFMRK